MKDVQVSFSELVRVFENSSDYSEYYLDLSSGEVQFFSPIDFPEHTEIMKKMDQNTGRYLKLPKLTVPFANQVKQDFIASVSDPYLKDLLKKNLATKGDIRTVLMEFEEPRRRWYRFQNERYLAFLKEWFSERGVNIIDRPHRNTNIKQA
ncbi:MAG: UPF0158 family protein [Firmicutes bacterium]|nr:UPF0158 family protein [Bacillota bacterium]